MIALLTNDLMFQSRVSGAVKAVGGTLCVDRTVERLADRCSDKEGVSLVLIDLAFPLELQQAIPSLRATFSQAKILAFGPHVDVERLAEAEELGADRVMTRGQFDRDLLSLVS